MKIQDILILGICLICLFGCGKSSNNAISPNPTYLASIIGTWEIDITATLAQEEIIILSSKDRSMFKADISTIPPFSIGKSGEIIANGVVVNLTGAGSSYLEYGTAYMDGLELNDGEIYRLILLEDGHLKLQPNAGSPTLYKRQSIK